ncbi:MAG: pantoate--beta-alanine ligase [Cyclobacteriaceae bacterium]|nr:MAG: pantoate--beta-alanine ligase [Cyclobacteriaceae bacterium]
MQIFREIKPLRAFLVEKWRAGQKPGFVPTMGALHRGHLELVAASRANHPFTVCSVFVNPTQFNNAEDFAKYPRNIERDIDLLKQEGCDVLFCPDEAEMRPDSQFLNFDFGHLDKVMEGKFRPGHFSGVAQVVSKLFHIVEPDTAYFGQKDWQQFVIICTLVNELKFNVKLKAVETVREPDGLAMSSRNERLSEVQRKEATLLSKCLNEAREQLLHGKSVEDVKKSVTNTFNQNEALQLEYFEMVNAENLTPIKSVGDADRAILCMAAYVGGVRLIDNMFV